MRKLKTGVDTKDRTMPIGFIDHVNIRCEDLDESRRFYVEVIGLTAPLRIGELPEDIV